MTNLISIEGKTRPAEINESIVEMLTDVLAKARDGKIIGLSMATVHSDGDVGTWSSASDCFYKKLGAIEQLKFDVMKAHSDEQ